MITTKQMYAHARPAIHAETDGYEYPYPFRWCAFTKF